MPVPSYFVANPETVDVGESYVENHGVVISRGDFVARAGSRKKLFRFDPFEREERLHVVREDFVVFDDEDSHKTRVTVDSIANDCKGFVRKWYAIARAPFF